VVEISVTDLDRIITDKYICKGSWICWLKKMFYHIKTWYFDITYIPIPYNILNEVLNEWINSVLPGLKFTAEIWDCDDFASYFKGWLQMKLVFDMKLRLNGVGIALGTVYDRRGNELGGHAWNILVVEKNGNPDTVFLEPQTGEVFEDTSSKGYKYELEAVII